MVCFKSLRGTRGKDLEKMEGWSGKSEYFGRENFGRLSMYFEITIYNIIILYF